MAEQSGDTAFTFAGRGGQQIFVRKWAPAFGTPAKAIVQIAHGAAEHSLRYARVAKFLNAAGYLVYADDHRGHGRTAGALERAGIAGLDGWNAMLADLKQLTEIITTASPGLPIFLLGHSMGSLMAQRYTQLWGNGLRGVVLSGTFGSIPHLDATIAALEPQAHGDTADLPCAPFSESFASFNEPFAPGKTGYEWLSRDAAEVQKYVDDRWCGFPFSNRLVADLMKGARDAWAAENETRIPKDLPILIMVGDQDPVGGNPSTVRELIGRYTAGGLEHITSRFYPGARHELLNETNRDAVQQDLLEWLDARLG